MDEMLMKPAMCDGPIKGTLRKDAARNRARLIAAASECMRLEGGDVPMEVIAERAGVARGTIYRNFAHRQEMYRAVLDHDLDRLIEQIDRDGPADPLAFIRRMAEMMIVYERFLHLLARMADFKPVEAMPRMVAAIATPLRRAQALGLIRADLDGFDILTACRMLASHVRLDGLDDPAIAFARRFNLLLHGIGKPPV